MNILVITYWSFREPLIQAATLPYLEILSELVGPDDRIHLHTLEKPHLRLSAEELENQRVELDKLKITLITQNYHRFGFRAMLAWVMNLIKLTRYCRKNDIQIIHAFGSPAATSAHVLSKFTKLPYVVDSYEPHAESMVENGSWRKGGFAHRVLRYFERLQTRSAKGVLATTEGMRAYAAQTYRHIPRVFVTRPACVNTSLFNPQIKPVTQRSELGISDQAIVCIYAGKIGGIYLDREIFDFFSVCRKHWGDRFEVIMLSDASRDVIEALAKAAGLPTDIVTLRQVPHYDVPSYLALADFAINPVKPVPSKRYCTSIKDGEYWAMGLPVVIPANISDDSDLIREAEIGAVLESLSPAQYQSAVEEIDRLLEPSRRQAEKQRIAKIAEKYRGMHIARAAYAKLYGADGVLRKPTKSFLVLIYNSFRDPLFQNLMYRYLLRQSRENLHYHFDLITFEQRKYALTAEERRNTRILLASEGVEWHPLTYHSGAFMFIKKAWDFTNALVRVARIRLARRTKMIIAFANTSGSISLILSRLLKTKLMVYSYEPHSEFLAEFGIWKRNGWRFKVLNRLEQRLGKKAEYVLTGTRHMVETLQETAEGEVYRAPSSVDEKMFAFSASERQRIRAHHRIGSKKVMIYAGKFEGIYYGQEITDFCAELHANDPNWFFFFVTPVAHHVVRAFCEASRLSSSSYIIDEAQGSDEMSAWLSAADVGLTAIPPYPHQRYRSPVKVGEYLLCGLPYITCRGVSEDDEWAERENVGVVVSEISRASAREAAEAIDHLLNEDRNCLRERCRKVGIAYRGRHNVDPLFDQILAKA